MLVYLVLTLPARMIFVVEKIKTLTSTFSAFTMPLELIFRFLTSINNVFQPFKAEQGGTETISFIKEGRPLHRKPEGVPAKVPSPFFYYLLLEYNK